MHAYLVTGGNPDQRFIYIRKKLNEWNTGLFDQVTLEPSDATIGIEDIRQFQRRLGLKPYQSEMTVGIINNGGSLTIQAQNALLKTLEEPPKSVRFLIACGNKDTLLETIVSRCEVIDLGSTTAHSSETLREVQETITKLQKSSVGNRATIIDTIAITRLDTALWVERAIYAMRETMLTADNPLPQTWLLRALLRAQQHLAANVTPTLVLDSIFLSLSEQS